MKYIAPEVKCIRHKSQMFDSFSSIRDADAVQSVKALRGCTRPRDRKSIGMESPLRVSNPSPT